MFTNHIKLNEYKKLNIVSESKSIDYTSAYENMDKIMPDDNNLQWDFFNTLDHEELSYDEKKKELIQLITDNIDMDKFQTYIATGGTVEEFVDFILGVELPTNENKYVEVNPLIGKSVLVNAGKYKDAKGEIINIPKNLGNVAKIKFEDNSIAIIARVDFKLLKESKSIDFDKELHKILDQYPNNAKTWKEADDFIRELTRSVRTSYNELMLDVLEGEKGYIESLNFRSFKTPSEWNTKSKKQILSLWPKMNDWAKENALKDFIENEINENIDNDIKYYNELLNKKDAIITIIKKNNDNIIYVNGQTAFNQNDKAMNDENNKKLIITCI